MGSEMCIRDRHRQLIISTLCPPIFDRHVPVLDVTGFAQASTKRAEIVTRQFKRRKVKKPNHRRRRLLRVRSERPSGCRASSTFYEVATSHWCPVAARIQARTSYRLKSAKWKGAQRSQCPLWVKSRHVQCKTPCPLYPRKQTCAVQLGMSALAQKRTSRYSSRACREPCATGVTTGR